MILNISNITNKTKICMANLIIAYLKLPSPDQIFFTLIRIYRLCRTKLDAKIKNLICFIIVWVNKKHNNLDNM